MSDLPTVREQFPSLAREIGGRPCIFADAPGGTQVPESVIEAIAGYLRTSNANSGGVFATSRETDEMLALARSAAAAFVGADPAEVVFGPSMTALAFNLSRSLGRELAAGDEVVVTRLDHDANISPWMAAAAESGAAVKWVDFNPFDCTLDLDSLRRAVSARTKIVAFPLASNALGTITPAREVVDIAREAGAIVIADAVHFAPHRHIDARELGVDVLFCSPYKFFGPHLGVMFGRGDLLDAWHAYRVRPSSDKCPDRWENGTKNHEGLAGFVAAVDYLASIGSDFGGAVGTVHDRLAAGMRVIEEYEQSLSRRFLEGLREIERVRLYGIADVDRVAERTPTFALRTSEHSPAAAAELLGERGVFAWDGNYYALEVMTRLGLEGSGGALRIGFCHYNTLDEVDRVLEELAALP